MPDILTFVVVPPLRCYHSAPGKTLAVCGELARWTRLGPAGITSGLFCDRHRGPTDAPIADVVLFQRVRVAALVDFAGASLVPKVAQLEAVARLEMAVERAGGLLNTLDITACLGQGRPQAVGQSGNGAQVGR